MKTRLGLDIGTNSIGWALVSMDLENNYERILDGGVRIIPMNEKQKTEFESGQTITKNAGRREKRSARRLRHRYLARRNNLLSLFELLGFEKELLQSPTLKTPSEEYGIRAKALDSKVDLLDFCRILYRLNQRRGYKSNRKERINESNNKYLVNAFISHQEETGRILRGKKELQIKLSTGESGTSTDSKILSNGPSSFQEIEVTKTVSKKGETSYTFSMPNPDNWQGRILMMEHELKSKNLTPGQYFSSKLSQSQHYKVREKLIYRSFYIEEFDKIWREQEKHHPILSDPSILSKVLTTLLPENSPHFEFWKEKGLKDFVKDYIIFYQRPLKTKKSSVGDCPLEKGNKVIPFSHPLYQEAKIWIAINNVRLTDDDENRMMLPDSTKELIYNSLQNQEKVTKKDIKELLPPGLNLLRVDMIEDIKGNSTLNKINKAAKKAGISMGKLISNQEKLEELWLLLYSVDESDHVIKALQKNFGLTEDQATHFEKITFKTDRGAYSAKAYRKLLPFLRAGKYSVIHPKSENLEKNLALLSEKDKNQIPDINNPNGLPEYIAIMLAYGSYQARNEMEKFETPTQIELLKRHSLRNPIAEQVLNETLQMVRDIWEKHGRPEDIVVELARDLKKSAKERKEATDKLILRNQENDKIRSILESDFDISNPTRKDILRYRLWEEQGHECPYSIQKIQKSDLFNGNTDIDHIIPRQRYYDDSISNKVLTFRSENENKSNKTAFEYISEKGEKYLLSYQSWVKLARISFRKKRLLLAKEIPDDFTNRQLALTRYISKKAIEILDPIAANKAYITSGNITDKIKEQWGLNEMFKKIQIPRFERLARIHQDESWIKYETRNGKPYLNLKNWDKRIDHRHHALDALVVALTSQSFIQRLNNLNVWFEKNREGERAQKMRAQFLPIPSPEFRKDAEEFLSGIIVSHKKTERLLTRTTNKYQSRNAQTGKLEVKRQTGKAFAVRNQLHDELPYGKVKIIKEKPDGLAIALREPEKIHHEWQRKLILDYLNEFEGDAGKAIKGLKTKPILKSNGIPLEEVWLYEEWYIKNRKLDVNITSKQLDNIPDKKLKAEIFDHLKTYQQNIKKAFSDEGLLEFNKNRKIPVKSVRTLVKGDLTQIKKKDGSSKNEKYYVDPSNNFAFLIYEEIETGKRIYEVLSFIDAVNMKL
jgi:CRISPR subtype II RNA-guided endonuclease Cas9/Csn1